MTHIKGAEEYAALLVSLANLFDCSTYHDWCLTWNDVNSAIKKLEKAKLSRI